MPYLFFVYHVVLVYIEDWVSFVGSLLFGIFLLWPILDFCFMKINLFI